MYTPKLWAPNFIRQALEARKSHTDPDPIIGGVSSHSHLLSTLKINKDTL